MKKDEKNKDLLLKIFILAVGFTAVIIFSSVPFGKKALDEPVVEPAKEFFPMSWLFASGGHSIQPSASASVLPVNIQD